MMDPRTNWRAYAAVTAGILCMSISGSMYAFSAYSKALKEQLKLSNSEATNIITVGNIGLCFAGHVGLVCDKFGPRVALAIGAILSFTGYFLSYLMVNGSLEVDARVLTVLFLMIGQGSQFTYMPGFLTSLNFPSEHRGKVIGVLDCAFGLSAAIFSRVYTLFDSDADAENQNVSGFLLASAIIMVSVSAGSSVLVRVPGKEERLQEDKQEREEQAKGVKQSLLHDDGESGLTNTSHNPNPSRPLAWHAAFWRVEFWVVFLYFSLLAGTGLTYMNNVAYIVSAIGGSDSDGTLHSTLLSVASSVARVLVGIIADTQKERVPTSVMMVVAAAVTLVADLCASFAMESQLVLCSLLVGFAFGSIWCLTPYVLGERFGSLHFGLNWGFVIIGSAAGPLVIQPVQEHFYNQHKKPSDDDCYGADCYQNTFIICASLCAVAMVLASYLVYKQPKSRHS